MKVEYYGSGRMRFPGICLGCKGPMKSGEEAYFALVGRSKKTAHPGCRAKDAPVAQQDIPEGVRQDPAVLEVLREFSGALMSFKEGGSLEDVAVDLNKNKLMIGWKKNVANHQTKEGRSDG